MILNSIFDGESRISPIWKVDIVTLSNKKLPSRITEFSLDLEFWPATSPPVRPRQGGGELWSWGGGRKQLNVNRTWNIVSVISGKIGSRFFGHFETLDCVWTEQSSLAAETANTDTELSWGLSFDQLQVQGRCYWRLVQWLNHITTHSWNHQRPWPFPYATWSRNMAPMLFCSWKVGPKTNKSGIRIGDHFLSYILETPVHGRRLYSCTSVHPVAVLCWV